MRKYVVKGWSSLSSRSHCPSASLFHHPQNVGLSTYIVKMSSASPGIIPGFKVERQRATPTESIPWSQKSKRFSKNLSRLYLGLWCHMPPPRSKGFWEYCFHEQCKSSDILWRSNQNLIWYPFQAWILLSLPSSQQMIKPINIIEYRQYARL